MFCRFPNLFPVYQRPGTNGFRASFAPLTYTISASAGANGSITPGGAVTVAYGGSQHFSIVPATGYHVADVLADGVSAGAVTSYAFTNVAADHTLAASFALNTYTITAMTGSTVDTSYSGTVDTVCSDVAAGVVCPATPSAFVDGAEATLPSAANFFSCTVDAREAGIGSFDPSGSETTAANEEG